MRTNGFALFRGQDCHARAAASATRVRRYCGQLAFSDGPRFESWSKRVDRVGDECVAAYALDGSRGLPLVHGFLEGNGHRRAIQTGEYSMLAWEGDVLVASRDTLGTRPLYVDRIGSCVATDHRFFTESPRLIPSGAKLVMGSMDLTVRPLAKGKSREGIDQCAARLSRVLTDAVAMRLEGRKKVAVSFSGGLDSSLIAMIAAKKAEVTLCSAFASGSRDQSAARAAANVLGLEMVGVEVDRASAAQELRMLDLPFRPTPMDKALWCIYSTTARAAAESGAELIMLGQLADELFGGYMKYALLARESEEEAAEAMRADVVASGERAFIRDEEACARFTEARFPFADEKLVAFALALPVAYKISGGERKVVLRRAASLLGLPDALTGAPKKAAQYSSGIAKLVD